MRLAWLLVLAALPVRATTVTLQRDAVPVAQGEVCWFRAGDAENPFARWLMSQDLRCADAAAPLSLPAGLWNVFGRTPDAVSRPVLVSGDAMPDSLAFPLRSAAVLERGPNTIAYAPRLAAAWPPELVPAGEELLLFVVEKGAPVAVVPVAALEAGSRRAIDVRPGGPSAIIGWMQVPESDRTAVAAARGLSPPRVRAGSIHSDALPPLDVLSGAFVRIRGVSAGRTEVAVEGRGFIPSRRSVEVESSITTILDPLIVRPAATLIIHWSTDGDVLKLDRSLGSCNEHAEAQAPAITIASCTTPQPGRPPDPSSCSTIREEPVDLSPGFGAITVDDVPPGAYRAELRIGKLPPVAAATSVSALDVRHMTLRAAYHLLTGSVTLGGEPLDDDVELHFSGGYGFKRRDENDYLVALLMPVFGPDTQVTVKACDGAPNAVVISESFARGSTRYDVDIPANELVIRITDTFTREPLDGAAVRYTVMSKMMRPRRRPVFTRTFLSADGGVVMIPHVPEREIELQVTHSGYQKKDVEPFSITKFERREVDVQLVPLRGTQGRVVSPKPFENATVLWFAPSGFETERAELGRDGVFVYANSHGPEETMTVVSSSHPLWVTPARSFHVAFPDVAARTLFVELQGADTRDTRHAGVVIGGIRVPVPALQLHQSLRREMASVSIRRPLVLRDLADIAPLEILLGPQIGEVASRATAMDFFALEQFANPPKKAVPPGASRVVFVMGP